VAGARTVQGRSALALFSRYQIVISSYKGTNFLLKFDV